MVVGSFASTAYGEPRSTYDLDLVIDPGIDQLNQLLTGLDPERYYVDADVARDAFRRRSMINVIEIETAWKLDLVIRKARPFSVEELRRRQSSISPSSGNASVRSATVAYRANCQRRFDVALVDRGSEIRQRGLREPSCFFRTDPSDRS